MNCEATMVIFSAGRNRLPRRRPTRRRSVSVINSLSSVHSALYSIPAAVDRLFQHRVVQFEETQVVVAADVDERTKAERKEHGDGEFLHQFMFQRLLEDLAAQVLFL